MILTVKMEILILTEETVNRIIDLIEKYGGAAFAMYMVYSAVVLAIAVTIFIYVIYKLTDKQKRMERVMRKNSQLMKRHKQSTCRRK